MKLQAPLKMRSKVTISRPGSPSLRVTIPSGYAQLLRLKAGDELEFDHEVMPSGKIVLKVSKVEKKG